MSKAYETHHRFTYRRGPLFWFGVLAVLGALVLSFWPVDFGQLTTRLLLIAALLVASTAALYHDLESRSRLALRLWWSNSLFLLGMICLPLQYSGELPWYVSAVSMLSLLASLYLNWWVYREKKRLAAEKPSPPLE